MTVNRKRLTKMVWMFGMKELMPLKRIFISLAAVNLLNGLVLGCGSFPLDEEYFEGSAVALTILVSGMAGHSSLFFERKRRHGILLRSLPVGARFVSWAKMLSAWATALSITAMAAIPSVIWGNTPGFGVWCLLLAATGILVTSSFFATLVFRNEVLQQTPWAAAMLVSGFSTDYWRTIGDWLTTYPWTTLILSLTIASVLTELAVPILHRRELDW